MKRLSTIRHGQSQGNKQKIIQGKTTNLELTDEGKDNIRNIVNKNIEELSIAKRIVTSPYKRTIETSKIISELTGISIVINEKIIEFDAGILSGHTHNENAKKYPEYYKVWLERGDLDKIPGAEKGNELQARVIAFLMEYYDKEEFLDIVVSHAGFLRCLINTSRGVHRTTQLNSENGAIHIIDNPFESLKIEHKNRAMSSKVYIIETFEEKYVVKLKNRKLQKEDFEEKRILNLLDNYLENVPIIYHLSETNSGSIKVLKFVNGNTIFGILDSATQKALIEQFCKMRDILKNIKSKLYNPNNIYSEVEKLVKMTKRDYVKRYGQSILEDKFNKSELEISNYSLIHNDLNRDNILFLKNKDGTVIVNIIDWEGIGLYPYDYQLASFLVTSFLIEGYSVEETIKIAKQIDFNINEKFIIYLMKFRIFKGLYFFVESENIYTVNNQNISNEILKKYFFAAEKLKLYEVKNNLIGISNSSNRMKNINSIQFDDERKI